MQKSRTFVAVLVPLISGLISGCGSQGSPPSAAKADSKGSGNAQEFTLHKVMDSEGTGKLAGTYLIPKGWSTTDKLTWITNDFLTPVVGRCKVTAPDGITQLDEVSALSVTYGRAPTGNFGMKPPSNLGAFLVSGWKQEHKGISFSIVSEQDTPIDKSIFAASGAPVSYAKTGAVKLRYKVEGKPVLVKIYARLDVESTGEMATGMGGTMNEGSWLISNAWTATAPEAEFPDAMKSFGVILSSYRVDPHFFNTVVQCQQVIQRNFYNGMRQIQETSRIISQTNDEMSDMIMKGYENQQAAQDHEVQNFDDYIRGVQRYNDEGGTVALPNDYNHAWSDGNGNYLMTDDSSYDPNSSGAPGSWHALDPAH